MIKVNNFLIEPTRFPDNTIQVWNLPDDILQQDRVAIEWEFFHDSDIMMLAQLKTLLDNHNIKTHLFINYLPYGRQDKVVSNKTTFGLKTLAGLLNHMSFDKISCIDPHSDIAAKWIRNFEVVWPDKPISGAFETVDADIVCYPDKGAFDKYSHRYGYPFVYGEKERDQATGNIVNYNLVTLGFGVEDKVVLIIDDICDGGATFVMLAEKLFKEKAKEVNLYVSHGIFSKGLKPLYNAGINRIFTKTGEENEQKNQEKVD